MSATRDNLLFALASFVSDARRDHDARVIRAAKDAMLDAFAVSLGALSHPAAQVARRYARHHEVPVGASLWGSGRIVTAETAALVNGVPLRGYDYNDLYMGKSGGHPSDMIPGLVAVAETRGLTGGTLLDALLVGFEVTIELFDAADLRSAGWDYPVVTAIGATCGIARLIGLSQTQTREALAITVVSHFASRESESNELNERGDLTMWKRFNGSDAIRQSVYACLLAESGAEGVVRPFEGKHGFVAKAGIGSAEHARLLDRLTKNSASRIGEITYKRWPVGSRAQSAIQAACEARAGVKDPWAIRSVRVHADPQAYDHLVSQREEPFRPGSRETADHSLPCIVASAILDGEITVESFDPARVTDPARLAFLAERVTVEPDEALKGGAATGFLTRVEITDADGRVHIGEAKAPPGHRDQPFVDADFDSKFAANVNSRYGAVRSREIAGALRALDSMPDVRELTRLLVLADPRAIETA